MPNGAQALMQTLIDSGVDTCFTNPGTSEMHFVAALDSTPAMRAVLTLFEGVATGAADGYARMADKPAATLLHLGCGLGNGMANLHNARKARVPMLNIVGDHATSHAEYDTPLQSDIETLAKNCSPNWLRRASNTATLCQDAAEAITASKTAPGHIATLILPADASWGEGGMATQAAEPPQPPSVEDSTLSTIRDALLQPGKKAFLLGGRALRKDALLLLSQIAQKSGAHLFHEVFPTRIARGAGTPQVERLAYLAEMASIQLAQFEHLILVDAIAPVSFFAYPNKKAYLVPSSCALHTLAASGQDVMGSIEKLHRALAASDAAPALLRLAPPKLPSGKFNAHKACQAIAALLPENAIIVDESQTSGLMLQKFTATAPAHDFLALTGGSIGFSLPNAIGAAVACPKRKVFALTGDGSAMYTPQALWTMAREQLDIVTIIFNNRSYSILNLELQRVGVQAGAGAKANAQLDLRSPAIDFTQMALSMGVQAVQCDSTEAFVAALQNAINNPGPHLIEALVAPTVAGAKLRMLSTVVSALDKMPNALARQVKRLIAP